MTMKFFPSESLLCFNYICTLYTLTLIYTFLFQGPYLEESYSSEYVTLEGSQEGPEMQESLFDHAMVGINITHSLIIGGESKVYGNCEELGNCGQSNRNAGMRKTQYFDHSTEQWTVGPELLYLRSLHDVGIVRDQATKQTLVVVTGGRDWEEDLYGFERTEILIGNNWQPGKVHYI